MEAPRSLHGFQGCEPDSSPGSSFSPLAALNAQILRGKSRQRRRPASKGHREAAATQAPGVQGPRARSLAARRSTPAPLVLSLKCCLDADVWRTNAPASCGPVASERHKWFGPEPVHMDVFAEFGIALSKRYPDELAQDVPRLRDQPLARAGFLPRPLGQIRRRRPRPYRALTVPQHGGQPTTKP